ncbi:hypothetical protein [Microbulbifer hainanensis]|uniref:hypothetical protein n=1 Tax=Microbulbifer hainanensis TaxID=2735675 RepID=UPI00186696CA|nr:hypothetical protein [Microbulbifer hainanensis]
MLAVVLTTIVLGACASGNYYYAATPLPAGQLSSGPYYYPSTGSTYNRGGYAEDALPYVYPSGGSYLYYSTREYYLPYYYPYYPNRYYGRLHRYHPYKRYRPYRGHYSYRHHRPQQVYRSTGRAHRSYRIDGRRLDGNRQRINGGLRAHDNRHIGRVYRSGSEHRAGRVYPLQGQPRARGRQNIHSRQRLRGSRPPQSGHHRYRVQRHPGSYHLRGDGQGRERGQQLQRGRR